MFLQTVLRTLRQSVLSSTKYHVRMISRASIHIPPKDDNPVGERKTPTDGTIRDEKIVGDRRDETTENMKNNVDLSGSSSTSPNFTPFAAKNNTDPTDANKKNIDKNDGTEGISADSEIRTQEAAKEEAKPEKAHANRA